MLDVLFYEAFEEEERALRKQLPSHIRAAYTKKTIQENGGSTCPSKLVSIRTQSVIPKEWAGSLKGILTRSQGYDHLVAYRRETGLKIPCGYLDNYCARAVAEQAILTMMALLRRFKKQIDQVATFNRDGLTGLEWRGRNVFVIGVGHIGEEIAAIAKGLGMHVKGHDIKQKVKDIQYTTLPFGVAWADVIFCALPLTDQTRGMLTYDLLSKAKHGSVFINIARGEIAPLEELSKLLEADILGGVGLDVYPQEALLAQHRRSQEPATTEAEQIVEAFLRHERVICTPHNAFNTREALEQKAVLSAQAVAAFLKQGAFPTPVPGA